jgi:hypothetical protein
VIQLSARRKILDAITQELVWVDIGVVSRQQNQLRLSLLQCSIERLFWEALKAATPPGKTPSRPVSARRPTPTRPGPSKAISAMKLVKWDCEIAARVMGIGLVENEIEG